VSSVVGIDRKNRAFEGYVFCDIDGTLLQARGAGSEAFGQAFAEAFGLLPDMSKVSFLGATDLRIVEGLTREYGLRFDPEKTRRFFDLLPKRLEAQMRRHPPRLFPGVVDFLERVFADWRLGVISGNVRETAMLKLRHAGIERFFADVGGFGDDDGDRVRMAQLALERAGRPARAVLIGDTPSDIGAAKANGMFSVGVSNGGYSVEELMESGADLAIVSFAEAEALFRRLESPADRGRGR